LSYGAKREQIVTGDGLGGILNLTRAHDSVLPYVGTGCDPKQTKKPHDSN
jgi:hypothetical protein